MTRTLHQFTCITSKLSAIFRTRFCFCMTRWMHPLLPILESWKNHSSKWPW